MHFDGSSFIVRNAGHSAGFDENNLLNVYWFISFPRRKQFNIIFLKQPTIKKKDFGKFCISETWVFNHEKLWN